MAISITGLSSGLDTAAMIKALMDVEKLPYTRLESQKSFLKSEQTVFRTLNTKMSTLSTAVSDLLLSSNFSLVSGKSSNETVAKISASANASTGAFNLTVNSVAQSHAIKSGNITTTGTSLLGTTLSIGDIDINIANDGTFQNDGEALEYVKNQINSKNTGLSAVVINVSETEKALLLSSKETGIKNSMTLDNTDTSGKILLKGTTLSALGITDIAASETQAAKDAEIVLNGVTITNSSNQIKDALSNTTIDVIGSGSTSINIAVDADKIADKINAFVTAYNDVVSTVRNNLAKPADETKMNPLQSDTLLKSISNQLYSVFNNLAGTESGFSMMSQIGLEIDKGITQGSLMTGTITFNKETFKQKMMENPEAVKNLFNYSLPTDDNTANNAADENVPGAFIVREGIMQKLKKVISDWTSAASGAISSRIKGYDSEISMLDDRMIQLSDRLAMKEASLKAKFANMEVLMSQLNSQKSWLSSQLSSLTAAASSSK